jgi:hypothetical protein
MHRVSVSLNTVCPRTRTQDPVATQQQPLERLLMCFLYGKKAGTSPSEKLKNHTSIKDQRSLKKDFIQLYFSRTQGCDVGLRFVEALEQFHSASKSGIQATMEYKPEIYE